MMTLSTETLEDLTTPVKEATVSDVLERVDDLVEGVKTFLNTDIIGDLTGGHFCAEAVRDDIDPGDYDGGEEDPAYKEAVDFFQRGWDAAAEQARRLIEDEFLQ